MIEFTDGEWFHISGRGNVYSTKMPVDFEGSLLNQEVLIEGNQYTVIGVETFRMLRDDLYAGRPVGLLIRGPRKVANEPK